jgi:PAS domain S-box-containing protein
MKKNTLIAVLLGAVVLAGLYATSLYSYLLFHSLAELFSVVVAFSIFALAWNSRRFLDNACLLFLGIAYLFVGGLDLVHMLAYGGMGVFAGFDSDLATQLWVGTRYVEAFSLVIAPLFLVHRLRPWGILAAYASVTALLLASVFYWGIFPECLVEGVGLTLFKRGSEYVICLVLLGAAYAMWARRRYFEPDVMRLLLASIGVTIASELAFTLYADVYGLLNMVGHYLKIISFYLIYRAIVQTGLTRPQALLFTDLKRAEEALIGAKAGLEAQVRERTSQLRESIKGARESEANLRAFIDGSPDAICTRDLEGGLILWNSVFDERLKLLFGVDICVGMTAEDYMPRESLAGFASQCALFARALAGEAQRTEFEYIMPDESVHYFETEWSPICSGAEISGVAEVTRDVTERRSAEDRLHQAELTYRTVADFTYDWEYWEDADGTLRYISPSCERISGYGPEDFLADPELLNRIVLPEDSNVWAEHRRLARQETGLHEARFRIRSRDGQVRWIEHACLPVTHSEGRSLGFRASNRDVTERHQVEESARLLRDELAHVTRVAALGELATSLAHELNQPLTAVLSNAQAALRWLAADPPNLDEVREALSDIVEDDHRAAQVIQGLRDMVKKSETVRVALDMNGLVGEVLRLVHSETVLMGVTVREDLADGLPTVLGDRAQVQQVLLNLVQNGVDAMVETALAQRELLVRTCLGEGGSVQICVVDSGPGLPDESLARMFEPFYTTKSGGLGMGLSISQSIVEAHGGRIWGERSLAGGLAVSFVLLANAGKDGV